MSRSNFAANTATNTDKLLDAAGRESSRKKIVETKNISGGTHSPVGTSRPKPELRNSTQQNASNKLADASQKQRNKSMSSPPRGNLPSCSTEAPIISQSALYNTESKSFTKSVPHRQASESDSIDSIGLAAIANTPGKKTNSDRRDDSFTQMSRNTNASVSTTSPSQQTDNVLLSDTDASSEYYGSARHSRLHSESDSKGFGTLASRSTPFEEEDEHDDDDDEDEIIDSSLALNFLMEHRIFLKAALNLLTERDRHAPELGMMDPNVLKSGPLKKASHLMNGVWKVKYVEVRRGMFSYYENAVSKDSQGEGELLRKNIPLEATTVKCRAVKLHQKALKFSPTG